MILSISEIKLFKACRRAWWLKYHEGLEPIEKPDALRVGSNYHAKLETLYTTNTLDTSDYSKESAMAAAYLKYILPGFTVKSVEDWFKYDLGDGDTLIGRTDGITKDGALVEHKTTSGEIGEEYEYNLQWDEQVLAYMLANNTRGMWYTVVKKPTIRKKQNEMDEDFFERMVKWYDKDTASKIRLIWVTRTDEEIEAYKQDLLAMRDEIKNTVNHYKNPGYCRAWGRDCEYKTICLNYCENESYIDFEKKGERYGITEINNN